MIIYCERTFSDQSTLVDMKVSCIQMFVMVWMVNTLLTFLVSIVSPFWVVCVSSSDAHYGLIGNCTDKCHWYFEEDFAALKKLPGWFKATQGLMAVGLLADVIALCVSLCKYHRLTVGLLLLSFISTLVGIVVFCVSANLKMGVELNKGSCGNFGWSLWICVVSTGMAFVASGIFTCAGRDETEDSED